MFFIRSAAVADLAAVSALLGRSWHATYDALYGADRVEALTQSWHSPDRLKAQLARPDSEFVLADDGKQLAGMAYAAMDEQVKDTVILHQLYVSPDMAGQGIGRDLFAELETCFPDAKRMRLEVAPENTRAISFYAGLGFAEVGRTEDCAAKETGLAALIMEKPLAL